MSQRQPQERSLLDQVIIPDSQLQQPTMPTALTFAQTSEHPSEFLRLQAYALPSPGSKEVLIRMLAASINPQDFMVLAGKYPVKPQHSEQGEAIPGYDGVAEILQLGEDITKLCVGQWVVPRQHGLGTWRSHAVVSEDSLIPVKSGIDIQLAAMLKMCATPAYLLLEDMRHLKPGDWVIQNAASGTIGRMLIQFARVKGLHTINIIRDRDEQAANALKFALRELGADLTLTESELSASKPLGSDKRIILGLDAVFGASGSNLAAHLSANATYVNYGSLGADWSSFELTQDMIFWKQISFRNFRLSNQLASRAESEIADMINWFVELSCKGLLTAGDPDLIYWNVRDVEASCVGMGAQLKEGVSKAARRGVGDARKMLFCFNQCQN